MPCYSARSFWAPGDPKYHGDQEHRRDLRFRQAPEVGVLIPKVSNTLVQWLRWMASSYAGRLDTKMTFLRSACLHT
jgi:hypothetical protein